MKTVLFIHGGKIQGERPTQRFRSRLEQAIAYYHRHHDSEEIVFLVSGRWDNVTENFLKTEAEIGKTIILAEIPDATVIKEDISVELIGNYAFSKPLLGALNPDKVIIITSEYLENRVKAIRQKIFGDVYACEYEFIEDELSHNQTLIDKEVNALALFQRLFAEVQDGDDEASRDILLYRTPYYFKGIVDDRTYFDTYWPGGYDHFLQGIVMRNAKG